MTRRSVPRLEGTNFKLLWGTRRSFLAALGLLVLGAVMVFFFIFPQFKQAYTNYQAWNKAKAQREQVQKKLDDLTAIEQAPEFKYESLVNTALPDRKPLLELIQSLSVVSRETGVVIDRFELTPGSLASESATSTQGPANRSDFLSVEFSISGTFNQVNDFLRRIEEVTPFSTIVALSIGSEITEIDQASDLFTADITSETYFFIGSVASGESDALPRLSAEAEQILVALEQYAPVVVERGTEILGGNEQPFGETLDLFGLGDGVNIEESGTNQSPSPTPGPTVQPTPSPVAE